MIHDSGNRILDRMEASFGRLALPQILRWIAGFQAMSWGLSLFSREYLEFIAFDRGAILSGQASFFLGSESCFRGTIADRNLHRFDRADVHVLHQRLTGKSLGSLPSQRLRGLNDLVTSHSRLPPHAPSFPWNTQRNFLLGYLSCFCRLVSKSHHSPDDDYPNQGEMARLGKHPPSSRYGASERFLGSTCRSHWHDALPAIICPGLCIGSQAEQ